MKLSYRIAGPCWLIGSMSLAACAGSISDPSDLGTDDVETTDDTGTGEEGASSNGVGLPPGALRPGRGFGSLDNVELPATDHDTLRYIVKFKEAESAPFKTMSGTQRANLLDRNRLEVVKRGGFVRSLLARINAVAADLTAEQVADLQASGEVEFIELDPVRQVFEPMATSSGITTQAETPYGIAMVQANQLSDAAAANIKVCITDTGYDANHVDLRPRTGANISGDANNGQGASTGNWYEDGAGHGTHVAGTIAAIGGNGTGVVGVLPGNKVGLHIVKVFNNSGNWAYGSDMIRAVEQCIAAGAKVISMSLGGSGSSNAERAAFDEASAQGVISIAAAGNGGNTQLSYPASYDSVMSVAAITSSKQLASFSQRNAAVDIAAPGVAVKSTIPGNRYASWDGTSMACPHVAGVAALVWANHQGCSASQIVQALYTTAEDLGTAGRDNSYGHGLVRAKAASDRLASLGCGGNPNPDPDPDPEPDPDPDPGPGDSELTNGAARTGLSGSTGTELRYFVNVPAGATNLNISISGGTGDADLYVRRGSQPTTSAYDCRPYLSGNSESCTTATPAAGTYYVLVRGYTSFAGVSVSASFSTSGGGGCQEGTYTATGLPAAIPDNNTTGLTSAVNVTTTGTVATLRLRAAITHPYRGDLRVALIAPNGTSYVLHNRTGGSADNLSFDGNVTAAVGAGAQGQWRLQVQDLAARDTGTLTSYSLTVTPTCN